MNKLKTLKDLDEPICENCDLELYSMNKPYQLHIGKDDLKQEVIKWIKMFNSSPMFLPEKISVYFSTIPLHTYRIEGAIAILKYILNISDEDLK